MNIAIIGSGQVGKRIGTTFARAGHEVIFYDVASEAFKGLEGFNTTLDIKKAITSSDISFMAVPTPVGPDHRYDLSYLAKASEACGAALAGRFHIFVIKSTVTPGTTEKVVIPAIEKGSGKKAGKDFGVIYNPEFLTVIENTWTKDKNFQIDSSKEGRIVLGEGADKGAGDIVERFYNNTVFETAEEKAEETADRIVYRKVRKPVTVYRTDYKTAEMTKLVANNRLPLAISYTNEVLKLYGEELRGKGINIDTDFIAKMVAMDPRIGKYGSVYGKAWGGPCFKKDTVAFRRWLEDTTGRRAKLVGGTIEINNEMNERFGMRE
ncbi:MAG: NAD(P)-binding domain-containing protein [Candidatus Aenigmatarchaeota archaeon]